MYVCDPLRGQLAYDTIMRYPLSSVFSSILRNFFVFYIIFSYLTLRDKTFVKYSPIKLILHSESTSGVPRVMIFVILTLLNAPKLPALNEEFLDHLNIFVYKITLLRILPPCTNTELIKSTGNCPKRKQ